MADQEYTKLNQFDKDSPGMDIKPSDLPHTTEEGASAPTPDDLPSYGEYHGVGIDSTDWSQFYLRN